MSTEFTNTTLAIQDKTADVCDETMSRLEDCRTCHCVPPPPLPTHRTKKCMVFMDIKIACGILVWG